MTSLVPDARRSFLAGLDWRIKEVASPSFVLPDFVALALDHAGTPSSWSRPTTTISPPC
jgi:hypothetical protein